MSESWCVSSGCSAPVTGYYSYQCHEDSEENCGAFIPSSRLLFKKGELTPKLGSCPHTVVWKLISEYK